MCARTRRVQQGSGNPYPCAWRGFKFCLSKCSQKESWDPHHPTFCHMLEAAWSSLFARNFGSKHLLPNFKLISIIWDQTDDVVKVWEQHHVIISDDVWTVCQRLHCNILHCCKGAPWSRSSPSNRASYTHCKESLRWDDHKPRLLF